MAYQNGNVRPKFNWCVWPAELNPRYFERLPIAERLHGFLPRQVTVAQQSSGMVNVVTHRNQPID